MNQYISMTGGSEPLSSASAHRANSLESSSSESSGPSSTMGVRLKDGAIIQTWIHDGSGTPLLFLYGLGCSKAHWKHQRRYFQNQGRLTIEIDFRGHGESTLGNPHRPMTIRALSQDTEEVLAHLGVTDVVVLGQSMGGCIGLRLAHDRPNLVKALVLQGSPGRNPFASMRLGFPVHKVAKILTALNRKSPRAMRLFNKIASGTPSLAREIVRRKGFNPNLAKTEDVDEYLRYFFASDANLFYELMDDLQDFDVTQLPHVIDCPSLIIAGAMDPVVPIDESRWLAKRLANAELEIIAHGSHCPHLEDPEFVNQRIDKFLKVYQP